MSGLAYCGCDLILRSGGNTDAVSFFDRRPFAWLRRTQEDVTRIVLALVVLFGECTVVAELAYLSWPESPTWMMGLALCGITANGVGSITLRVLARTSHVRESRK